MRQHDKHHVLALEWIGGTSAAELCSQARASQHPIDTALPLERAVRIARRCAHGLAAIHRAGLTCDSLNPSNVIVSGNGRVVIRGFGLPSADSTEPITAGGQAQGELADVHALGGVIFSLLAGRPPTPMDMLRLVTPDVEGPGRELRRTRATAPSELFDLVFELLAPSPDTDHDAEDVAHQLDVIERRIVRSAERVATVLLVGQQAAFLSSRLRRAHDRIVIKRARDAAEAIEAVMRTAPAVLILDMKLSGSMSAAELCMFLTSNAIDQSHTIALAEDIQPADARFLAHVGVDDLFSTTVTDTPSRVAGLTRDVVTRTPLRDRRVSRIIG
jgi:hypothetical protein